ncbi:MAG: DUF2279 domain-containing protein [Bacteroidetes bacterium]|nr:DUF2279 domain-containing protein [Bacteroidota bacterium]
MVHPKRPRSVASHATWRAVLALLGTVLLSPAAATARSGPLTWQPNVDTTVRVPGTLAADSATRTAGTIGDPEAARARTRGDTAGAAAAPDTARLVQAEYMYGETPRHTLTGSLPYRTTQLSSSTITIFGGALVALATGITIYQQKWYPDSTLQHFHFIADWTYSREVDKLGHAFGGWMSAYCSHEALIASGLSQEDAALWGAAGGLFFQTFIEVQDGFHAWGFDWTDETGNILGAGYYLAQQRVPMLQNFDPKWSVGPSRRDSARDAAQIRSRLLVDDYDRQDIWLSVKLHNLLPANLQPYWPKWLQLAIGAGARDVELRGYRSYRVIHLSLDYNLPELLPDLGPFGNWLVQSLNAFHLPAPALQLWPTVKFELIYPFHF